jgi:hypothetical protein
LANYQQNDHLVESALSIYEYCADRAPPFWAAGPLDVLDGDKTGFSVLHNARVA